MRPRARKTRSPGRKIALLLPLSALLLALSLALSGAEGPAEGRTPGAGAPVSMGAGELGSKGAEEQGSVLLSISAPQHLGSSAQPRTITYTYDAAGRLVGADYGEGKGITYGYDAAGNLVQREVTGATPTPTPTATPTPTPTSTPTNTPTATTTPAEFHLYLPVILHALALPAGM